MLEKKEVALTRAELSFILRRYENLLKCCEDEIVSAEADRKRYLKRIEELTEVWREYK